MAQNNMPGLLGEATPQGFGLLSRGLNNPLTNIGIGLLANSGPSLTPVSFGQALAGGFSMAQQAQARMMEGQLIRERLQDMTRKREASQALSDSLASTQPQGTANSRMLSALAKVDPAGAVKMLTQGPRGVEAKLSAVESRLGRELTDDEVMKLSGAGTTINIGEKLNEPIPVPQLPNVRLPDGTTPTLGTTFKEARDAGAKVTTSKERDTAGQTDSALAIIDELERLASGPEGIFSQVEPGVINRGVAAMQFALDDLTQGDPRVSQFRSLSKGSISSLVRMLGEKGSLSDGDVKRALSLLPETFPLPDTGTIAKSKINTLRDIIGKGVANLNRQSQTPGNQARIFTQQNVPAPASRNVGDVLNTTDGRTVQWDGRAWELVE